MRKLFLHIFVLSITYISQAQIHEIGVFAGGVNYVGDVGKMKHINPEEMGIGLIYKWNKSPRHAYRFSYYQGNIKANDLESEAANRYLRGFSFKNNIKELSAGLEFNFFPFDLHKFEMQYTPYVFTGINYFWFDEMYILNKEHHVYDRNKSLAIPMVVGFKARISNSFILAAEVGARYTFTDNLDGSNPENYQNLKFGNLNSNDWYMFSGLTLTYTFGENPCFCPN